MTNERRENVQDTNEQNNNINNEKEKREKERERGMMINLRNKKKCYLTTGAERR